MSLKPIQSVPAASIQRPMTIIAQDPTVTNSDGQILTTQVSIPAERLASGPWGHRIQVVDYDVTSKSFLQPWAFEQRDLLVDPYATKSSESLLRDPRFHAQNVYAIAMRILSRFEFAFGRRVAWSFQTHQLKIVPHAFRDANAYYDRRSESLKFGYFRNQDDDGEVFTCLSHDIVAHETTHAILDGLQSRYVYPSSPDQAAFHEAFSDIVALLSVFSLKEVVAKLLGNKRATSKSKPSKATISGEELRIGSLKDSLLFGLAEQFGSELRAVRGRPLRNSLALSPRNVYLDDPEFQEPHRRGEVLVAAMLNAFLRVFLRRVQALDAGKSGVFDRPRVVEEAAKTADHLLTIAIRALDYCPPVHLTFPAYLSALISSDSEVVGNDTMYGYRSELLTSFESFGIQPLEQGNEDEPGGWMSLQPGELSLNYSRSHFRAFQTDEQEVFRFLWENRDELGIRDDGYTRVLQVRPCLRISPEGFPLRETIVQYVQIADVRAGQLLSRFKIRRPNDETNPMKNNTRVTLHGGGTLVFDQYGQLKFNIVTPIDGDEQAKRVAYLWSVGYFREKTKPVIAKGFSQVHRLRAMRQDSAEFLSDEAWV